MTRVLIVDDQPGFRRHLRRLLDYAGLTVVGEAGDQGFGTGHAGRLQHLLLGCVPNDDRQMGLLEVAATLGVELDDGEGDSALAEHLHHSVSHPAVTAHHDVLGEFFHHRQIPSQTDHPSKLFDNFAASNWNNAEPFDFQPACNVCKRDRLVQRSPAA